MNESNNYDEQSQGGHEQTQDNVRPETRRLGPNDLFPKNVPSPDESSEAEHSDEDGIVNVDPNSGAGVGEHGMGEGEASISGGGAAGGTVLVGQAIEKFREKAILRRLKASTIGAYTSTFRSWAAHISGIVLPAREPREDIEEYYKRINAIIDKLPLDKKKLAGKKGADYINDFLKVKKETAWRFTIAAIKTIWIYGLELGWPAEMKIIRLPATGRAWSPEDETVKAWYEAVMKDPDEYFRLIFLLIAHHGWRPSHLCHMKWRNIVYEAGKPVKVQARGDIEGFKTKAEVEAWLCPQVQEALIAWITKEEVKAARRDDGVIIPHRDRNGRYIFEEVDSHVFVTRLHVLWHDFQKRWKLPALMPKALRHWVASKTREAGLSVPASARMMGHDVDKSIMRQVYDNPRSVRDEQRTKLPNGVLGLLCPPCVEIVEDIPSEAREVLRLRKARKIGFFDMCQRLETILDRETETTKDLETV